MNLRIRTTLCSSPTRNLRIRTTVCSSPIRNLRIRTTLRSSPTRNLRIRTTICSSPTRNLRIRTTVCSSPTRNLRIRTGIYSSLKTDGESQIPICWFPFLHFSFSIQSICSVRYKQGPRPDSPPVRPTRCASGTK